jgi:hypothetical protein
VYHIVTRRRAPTDPPDPVDDDEPEKKERVIHTRVPESLEAELRDRAKGLGISVSNLVRNVLGHAFGLVGDVVADSHAIARAARGENQQAGAPQTPPGDPAPAIEDVLGWQPFVLGKNAVCGRCNALLPRGSDAAVSIGDSRSPRIVICTTCLKELRA